MMQRYRIQKQLFPYASSRKLIDINGRLEIETVRSAAFFTSLFHLRVLLNHTVGGDDRWQLQLIP